MDYGIEEIGKAANQFLHKKDFIMVINPKEGLWFKNNDF